MNVFCGGVFGRDGFIFEGFRKETDLLKVSQKTFLSPAFVLKTLSPK